MTMWFCVGDPCRNPTLGPWFKRESEAVIRPPHLSPDSSIAIPYGVLRIRIIHAPAGELFHMS